MLERRPCYFDENVKSEKTEVFSNFFFLSSSTVSIFSSLVWSLSLPQTTMRLTAVAILRKREGDAAATDPLLLGFGADLSTFGFFQRGAVRDGAHVRRADRGEADRGRVPPGEGLNAMRCDARNTRECRLG